MISQKPSSIICEVDGKFILSYRLILDSDHPLPFTT